MITQKKTQNNTPILKTFFKLIPFLWVNDFKKRLCIVASILLMGISVWINIELPLIYKKVIDILSMQNKNLLSLVPVILILYCLLWVVGQIIAQARSITMACALKHGLRLLSLRVFTHLHTLSLRFHTNKHTGMIINALERAVSGFEIIFFGSLLFILPILIEMVIVIILLSVFYGAFYSIGLLIIFASYLFTGLIAIRYKNKKQIVENKARANTGAYIVDSLLNFETVKYFNNENYDYEQCDKILKAQESAGVAKQVSAGISQICQGVIIGAGLSYMTLMTSNAVVAGQMNISDFVLINGYIWRFVMPLHQLGHLLQQMHTGLHDISDVINLLEEKPEIQNAHNAIELKASFLKSGTFKANNNLEITFKNVTFGYAQQKPILNGVSFTIPAGKTVALVGASGAGKSTIARLLFRFYDVSQGQILINGHDIRNINQESLRSLIGVVPQDTVLFNNTLHYNIAYGCPTASQEEINHAIKLAHLDEFIKNLPEGDQTAVGERGLRLSGGEKQRVAIARVILKNPKIYIFDEATSSLDMHTEKEIQKNLEEISTEATTLIIAHRLSTIINADEILVLSNGLITERGKHHELIDKNGLYAQLWNQQIHDKFDSIKQIT